MATDVISKFKSSWNLETNKGQIAVFNSKGQSRTYHFDQNNVGEFTAVLQILQSADGALADSSSGICAESQN